MATEISWTDETWNPTIGCMKVSAGCERCYAIRNAYRLEHAFKQPPYQGLTRKLPDGSQNWTGVVRALPERLAIPLGWKQPRRIFVDSMSDLFHEDVPDEFIDQVFAVMAWTSRHTYQVLTKRPERMRAYLLDRERLSQIESAMCDRCTDQEGRLCGYGNDDCQLSAWLTLPLPNVWLGVSVEDQRAADERVPLLLQTPAAMRFLSCEPLVGPVELSDVSGWVDPTRWLGKRTLGPEGIAWVIAGGESGPDYRPMDLAWARSLRDQCAAADVPFFFKQHGGRTHAAGGCLLDGVEHKNFPKPREMAHA